VPSARDSVMKILGIRSLATSPPETGSRDKQSEKFKSGDLTAVTDD